MNDEIKEILDYFRKYATIRENTMISEIEDYITNLQQDNEDYKSRIEKAVEYIKLYASYDNNFCLDYHELNKLLNILQNGRDEE